VGEFKFNKNIINTLSEPYLIAEIGVNHEGSLDRAFELIDLCKMGGANAAKFQTYKAEKIASRHSPAYWDTSKEKTQSQFELFKKYDTFSENEYCKLAAYCKEIDIDFLSTPFDSEAVDFLDPLVPFFKIASADITNLPLLEKVAMKNKPILLSTGASNLDEITHTFNLLKDLGVKDIALMHCILNYPTDYYSAHLRMISGLAKEFPETLIGYSDHTVPDQKLSSLTTAYLLGATILEKHFTFDKSLPGNDHYHAMDMQDIINFRREISSLLTLLGRDECKFALPGEDPARLHARRSLVLKKGIKKGEIITKDNLIPKRPAHGISPMDIYKILGMKAIKDIPDDLPLQWEDFEITK